MTNGIPPAMQVMQMAGGKLVSRPLYAAVKLRIADLLAKGPRTVGALASESESQPAALYRMLRALASVGVFTETSGPGARLEDRTFSNTPLSEPLMAGPGGIRDMTLWMGDPAHEHAWEEIVYSVQTGKPCFDRSHGSGVFEYFEANPALGATFNAAMSSFSGRIGGAVLGAYDFGGLSTIVDVGGGHGVLLEEIVRATPGTRGIVFDLPKVIEGAKKRIASTDVASRLSTESGSFFDSVPAGGDAYILSHIVHDWDDERAADILRRCGEAMGSGGRVLVLEQVIAEGNDPDFGKLLDMEMLAMTPGGRERTEAEFRELFSPAGLRLDRVVRTEAPVCVIEGRAA